MHVRTCNCTVHLEFLTFTQSARVSKALYYRPHLPSRRALQATARIARSGHVPAIPAVETLDFSGVINSTRSYLTFLFRSSISPFIRCPLSSPLLVLATPIPPKIRRDSSPRFGFRIWILVQESKAPRAGVPAELVRLFCPLFFLLVNLLLQVLVRICPSLDPVQFAQFHWIPFSQPIFCANFVEIYIYSGFVCSPPLIFLVSISRKSWRFSMLRPP